MPLFPQLKISSITCKFWFVYLAVCVCVCGCSWMQICVFLLPYTLSTQCAFGSDLEGSLAWFVMLCNNSVCGFHGVSVPGLCPGLTVPPVCNFRGLPVKNYLRMHLVDIAHTHINVKTKGILTNTNTCTPFPPFTYLLLCSKMKRLFPNLFRNASTLQNWSFFPFPVCNEQTLYLQSGFGSCCSLILTLS